MDLNEERLKELEELGELQFTLNECSIIMGINRDEFLKEISIENSTVRIAYERGRLKASAAVRKAILTQAKNGSTPAQRQYMDLINSTNKSLTTNKFEQDDLYDFFDNAAGKTKQ